MANKRFNPDSKMERPNPGSMGGKPGGMVKTTDTGAAWTRLGGKRPTMNKVGFKHIKNLNETC